MERCTEVAKYKNYLPFAVISAVLPSLMMESVMEGNLVPGSNFIDDMITAQKMQNCEVNDDYGHESAKDFQEGKRNMLTKSLFPTTAPPCLRGTVINIIYLLNIKN